MNNTVIKVKRASIEKKIAKLNADLKEIQTVCTHPNAEHVNKASTGNYDPSADSYWADHSCPDCGRRWATDQNWDRK
jgi:hypothetical protein